MYPTEIEENPNQETPCKPMDPELEEKLQCAIDSFFAQKSFAPSPWLDSGSPKKAAAICPAESSRQHLLQQQQQPNVVPHTKCVNQPNVELLNGDKKDAWSQTVLTLPVDLDFETILGKYYVFDGDQQQQQCELANRSEDDIRQEPSLSESRDGLSVSSLRRKLFVNYDENAVPIPRVASPLDQADDPIFRLNLSPRTPDRTTTPQTIYTSPQYSSSPIALMRRGAAHRTTMTPPTDSASPSFSPIKTCNSRLEDGVSSEANHDDDASFMSTERSLLSNTSMIVLTNGRRHSHLTTADNMSVLQEYADGCAGVPSDFASSSPAAATTTDKNRMSFMEVVQDEGDAMQDQDLVFGIVTSS